MGNRKLVFVQPLMFARLLKTTTLRASVDNSSNKQQDHAIDHLLISRYKASCGVT